MFAAAVVSVYAITNDRQRGGLIEELSDLGRQILGTPVDSATLLSALLRDASRSCRRTHHTLEGLPVTDLKPAACRGSEHSPVPVLLRAWREPHDHLRMLDARLELSSV